MSDSAAEDAAMRAARLNFQLLAAQDPVAGTAAMLLADDPAWQVSEAHARALASCGLTDSRGRMHSIVREALRAMSAEEARDGG